MNVSEDITGETANRVAVASRASALAGITVGAVIPGIFLAAIPFAPLIGAVAGGVIGSALGGAFQRDEKSEPPR